MELDLQTIQALSSSTRLEILNELKKCGRTPSQISKGLGRSKSTVSSHLVTLKKSSLVQKDKQEGRKRVMYSLTDKARTIIEGRETHVDFSI